MVSTRTLKETLQVQKAVEPLVCDKPGCGKQIKKGRLVYYDPIIGFMCFRCGDNRLRAEAHRMNARLDGSKSFIHRRRKPLQGRQPSLLDYRAPQPGDPVCCGKPMRHLEPSQGKTRWKCDQCNTLMIERG